VSTGNAETSVEEVKYAVLYAPTATGYSAHVPDLPGCIGAAATLEATRLLMKEAIEGHLECMRDYGYAIPKPTTVAEEVEIPA
jgi:predicted RNase H-like HicB family nuclease